MRLLGQVVGSAGYAVGVERLYFDGNDDANRDDSPRANSLTQANYPT